MILQKKFISDCFIGISCAAGGFTDTYCVYPNKNSPRALVEVTLHEQFPLKRILSAKHTNTR